MPSASPDPSAETNASSETANLNPSPGAEGYEEWIKARASAVGVPVALEKEREARCVISSCAISTTCDDTAVVHEVEKKAAHLYDVTNMYYFELSYHTAVVVNPWQENV